MIHQCNAADRSKSTFHPSRTAPTRAARARHSSRFGNAPRGRPARTPAVAQDDHVPVGGDDLVGEVSGHAVSLKGLRGPLAIRSVALGAQNPVLAGRPTSVPPGTRAAPPPPPVRSTGWPARKHASGPCNSSSCDGPIPPAMRRCSPGGCSAGGSEPSYVAAPSTTSAGPRPPAAATRRASPFPDATADGGSARNRFPGQQRIGPLGKAHLPQLPAIYRPAQHAVLAGRYSGGQRRLHAGRGRECRLQRPGRRDLSLPIHKSRCWPSSRMLHGPRNVDHANPVHGAPQYKGRGDRPYFRPRKSGAVPFCD